MSDAPIRVLIVDDQRVIRDGLTMVVGLIDGVEVVGTASNGAEAIDQATQLRPDVVLMDLRMPEIDGVEATRVIIESERGRVVILTTYADDDSLFPALRAGASGYLTKDASAEQIAEAIVAVHAGRTWLDPVVQQRLAQSIAHPAPDRDAPRDDFDGLTAREIEVLALIGEGLSNTEICDRLFLSVATVKTHINRIFAKTAVRDRAQAVRYAYDHGITGPNRKTLP